MSKRLIGRYNIPLGELKVGYTYIIRDTSTNTLTLHEYCIEDKRKNVILVRVNPKTGNCLQWKKKDTITYQIIDFWKTEVPLVPTTETESENELDTWSYFSAAGKEKITEFFANNPNFPNNTNNE